MRIGVYGNGLDAVIACSELLAQGHHVLHFSGGAKIAGHFAGSANEHGVVDLGMVLLEKDIRNTPQRPLSEFSNEFGVNARGYLAESYEYLEKSLGALRPRKVKSRLENANEIGDYFIADCLEVFKTLYDEEIISLKARLSKVINNQESSFIHPRLKNQSNDETNDDLLTQIEIQYGPELADKLFGSFIRSLIGSKVITLPLRFHRKLWIPLYFPESIECAIKGKGTPLPELTFLEFTNGSLASNIKKLVESISSNEKYSISTLKYEDLHLADHSMDYRIFVNSVGDMSKLLRSKKIEDYADRILSKIVQGPRTQISILHFCIMEMENKTVMLQSPISNLFRYSITNGIVKNQSCISLEFGDTGDSTIEELFRVVQRIEPKIKKACEGALQIVPFSLRYLDMSLIEWKELCTDVIGEFPKDNCRVMPIHPDASSFNDNLVRGLAGSKGVCL